MGGGTGGGTGANNAVADLNNQFDNFGFNNASAPTGFDAAATTGFDAANFAGSAPP